MNLQLKGSTKEFKYYKNVYSNISLMNIVK